MVFLKDISLSLTTFYTTPLTTAVSMGWNGPGHLSLLFKNKYSTLSLISIIQWFNLCLKSLKIESGAIHFYYDNNLYLEKCTCDLAIWSFFFYHWIKDSINKLRCTAKKRLLHKKSYTRVPPPYAELHLLSSRVFVKWLMSELSRGIFFNRIWRFLGLWNYFQAFLRNLTFWKCSINSLDWSTFFSFLNSHNEEMSKLCSRQIKWRTQTRF